LGHGKRKSLQTLRQKSFPARYYTKPLTSATDLLGVGVALPFSIGAVVALLSDLPASILPLITGDLVFSGGLDTLLSG